MELFLKTVDEVTVKDIANIAKKLLSSPLTMASHGDGNLVKIAFFLSFSFCCKTSHVFPLSCYVQLFMFQAMTQ